MTNLLQPWDAVVVFKDGNRVDTHIGVREIVGIERRYKGETRTTVATDGTMETVEQNTPHIERMLYGSWLALHEPLDFDRWLDLVENIEEVEVEDIDPSQPAPGDGSSPTPQPTPDSTPPTGHLIS